MSFLFCCCFSTHRRRIEKLKTSLDTRRRFWWIRTQQSTIARVSKVSFEKNNAFLVAPHCLGRHCLFCVLQASKSHTARDHHWGTCTVQGPTPAHPTNTLSLAIIGYCAVALDNNTTTRSRLLNFKNSALPARYGSGVCPSHFGPDPTTIH